MAEESTKRIGADPPTLVRGLVLAGGGLKVAFQAGVLQVWLDEALIDGSPVEFHTADGASGGVFNLALWCQGASGRQIADRWRAHRPLRGATPHLGLPFRPSLLSSKGLRSHVIPDFGIDLGQVRNAPAARSKATFNIWDVTGQELVTLPPEKMTHDLLLAAVSLPLWFPAVRTNGRTYTDAVFANDGNLIQAIHSGATELWVIWTVSTTGRWLPGFVREFFQILETATNARLRSDLDRIRESNKKGPGAGEFERQIRVRLLSAEVPVDYLIVFRNSSIAKAVDLGVMHARKWCQEQQIAVESPPAPMAPDTGDVVFRERLQGAIVFGAKDPHNLPDGDELRLTLKLLIFVRDVRNFQQDPDHRAEVRGYVRCDAWPSERPIQQGSVELLIDGPGGTKRMKYTMTFRDPEGREFHLSGEKIVHHGGFVGSWPETSTLFTTLKGAGEGTAALVGSGILRISRRGFLHELMTFRGIAPTAAGRLQAIARYGGFFAGQLNDVRKQRLAPARRSPGWLTPVDLP